MANKRVLKLMEEHEAAQRLLASSTRELERIRASCRHDWGPEVYDPIIIEAYTIPGDPPGTCGVDWRPETRVPRKETPRWKRKCEECLLTQYTERTSEKVSRKPNFG